MSDWHTKVIPGLVSVTHSVFGEPVVLQQGEWSVETVGVYTPMSQPTAVGEPIQQPRVEVKAAALEGRSVSGMRAHVRGRWRPIVRPHDRDDGTIELELGMHG